MAVVAEEQVPRLEGLADKLIFHEVAEESDETLSTQSSDDRGTKGVSTNLIPYDDEVDLEETDQQDEPTEVTDLEALD